MELSCFAIGFLPAPALCLCFELVQASGKASGARLQRIPWLDAPTELRLDSALLRFTPVRRSAGMDCRTIALVGPILRQLPVRRALLDEVIE